MNVDGVRTERHGRILVVTMDRPKANAINHAMSRAMYRAFDRLQKDPELSVGILASANERIFSAGWDLKEVAAGIHLPDDYYDPVKGHGPGGFGGLAENWELNKPLVAAVRGAAVGGGFEITLACDTILAADDAYFQLPELMRGFLPDAGGIQRLPKLVPPKVASTMILTGRRMVAVEARGWGLVHCVVPAARLMDEAFNLATAISKSAPLAAQALKAVLRQNENLSAREASDRARRGHSGLPIYEQMMRSEDFYEGPRAFAEAGASLEGPIGFGLPSKGPDGIRNLTMRSGELREIWRYPVSSMSGERLQTATIEAAGVTGDRIAVLIDTITGEIAAPEKKKRWRGVPQIEARMTASRIEVRLPDGPWLDAGGGEGRAALEGFFMTPVAVERIAFTGAATGQNVVAPRYQRMPIHLLTTASLAGLRRLLPASRVDARRFRPNMVVDVGGDARGFPETDWPLGAEIEIGGVRLRIEQPCRRCAFPNLGQGDQPFDPAVLAAIVQHNGSNLGVFCSIVNAGSVSAGDPVRLI